MSLPAIIFFWNIFNFWSKNLFHWLTSPAIGLVLMVPSKLPDLSKAFKDIGWSNWKGASFNVEPFKSSSVTIFFFIFSKSFNFLRDLFKSLGLSL